MATAVNIVIATAIVVDFLFIVPSPSPSPKCCDMFFPPRLDGDEYLCKDLAKVRDWPIWTFPSDHPFMRHL